MAKRVAVVGALILLAVILVTYYTALKTGLYADDYEFLERAGRLDFLPYLKYYFTEYAYFRPVQYIVLKLEYLLFGSSAVAYHAVQILFHVANSLLLFVLTGRLTQTWQLGFLSALFYATLPVLGLAVLWIAVADPLSTFFYLIVVYLWVRYLQSNNRWLFLALIVCLIIALASKEMNATLLPTLWLVEKLLMPWEEKKVPDLPRRYALLGGVWIVYLAYAFIYQAERASAGSPNPLPAFASHAMQEFMPYLINIAAPWGLDASVNFLWLVTSIVLYLFLVRTTKSRALIFIGIVTVLVALPLLPFLCGCGRYLYMPIMVSAILFGALVYHLTHVLPRWRTIAGAFVALIVAGSGVSIADAAENYAGLVRNYREPIRVAARSHPTILNDMYFYFLEPPTGTKFLSGMFFLQYGPNVVIGSTESNAPAGLRDHAGAAVLYYDESGNVREQKVSASLHLQTTLSLPVDFDIPIRLEGFELTSSTLKQGEALVLLLYWRAVGKIDKDYTVFVHWVNEAGQILTGSDSQPRGGKAPTSAWNPNQFIVDSLVVPITSELPPGRGYRLEIGLYAQPTLERLSIVNERGQVLTDHIVIEPFDVAER